MRSAQSFFATAPGGVRLLTVEVAPEGGEVTVRAAGEVDAFTGPTFEDALVAALAMEPTQLLVDLTATTYFSASSVAILHRARRASAGAGGFRVVTRPGMVERVVAHLDRRPAAA